jgi:hypothetical protein
MGSYANRVKARRTREPLRRVPTVEETWARASVLPQEQRRLVIPTASGDLVSSDAWRLEQMANALKITIGMDIIRFQQWLDEGEWETVTNPTESYITYKLQGAQYSFLPGQTKKIPSPLAAHFRMKLSLLRAINNHDKYVGALENWQPLPDPEEAMKHPEFKRRVESYDQDIGNNTDVTPRNKVY